MPQNPCRQFPIIGSRVAIWITAQIHLMFAAFMLGVPMFAVVVEYVGYRTGEKRYDDLARWSLPIWIYVSTSGVAVYLLLYGLN